MTATMIAEKKPKRTAVPMNGVDTPTLLATIKAVGEQPGLAKFRFRTKNEWIAGTHSRSTMSSFYGAGAEHWHKAEYTADGDHPAVLCGADAGPTPVEWVLHALASCLMAGVANIAAARGVALKRVEATVEGDIDLRGILGLSNEVRNGYQNIRVHFEIDGDASRAELEQIVMQSKARSAVFDIVSKGVPVLIAVD
jgi:uncharacterized OsmC-like protein